MKEVIPWLRKNYMHSLHNFVVLSILERYNDENRWARLHEYSKQFDAWVVGTMNATEKELGKYSLISTAVSLQPIQTLQKSTIIEICESLGVPQRAIDNARLPDCLCGRDEFAAENIELIDALLRYDDISAWDDDIVVRAMAYIRDQKIENGFRNRVPYTI